MWTSSPRCCAKYANSGELPQQRRSKKRMIRVRKSVTALAGDVTSARLIWTEANTNFCRGEPIQPSPDKRTMHPKTVDPAQLRAYHIGLLLNLIWQERSISRAELARRTGLSTAVISEVLTQLLA